MIARCILCSELITSPGLVSIASDFELPEDMIEVASVKEFEDLADAMRDHLYQRHKEALLPFNFLISAMVAYFATLMLDAGDSAEFNAGQEKKLAWLLEKLPAVRVEVQISPQTPVT